MSRQTFANGDVLTSTALTPDAFQSLLQSVIAAIFGIDAIVDPQTAFYRVRCGWQQEGQPSWLITEDVCILRAVLVDEPFAKVRDDLIEANDDTTVTDSMGFTQVWKLHLAVYGPNCDSNARLILSAMTLEWVHDNLAASNIYWVPMSQRPVRVPEDFAGRWWSRTDLEIIFNELALESITVPSAAEVDVTVMTDTGSTVDVTIVAP